MDGEVPVRRFVQHVVDGGASLAAGALGVVLLAFAIEHLAAPLSLTLPARAVVARAGNAAPLRAPRRTFVTRRTLLRARPLVLRARLAHPYREPHEPHLTSVRKPQLHAPRELAPELAAVPRAMPERPVVVHRGHAGRASARVVMFTIGAVPPPLLAPAKRVETGRLRRISMAEPPLGFRPRLTLVAVPVNMRDVLVALPQPAALRR